MCIECECMVPQQGHTARDQRREGGEGAMCGVGGTGNRQELEGKRQEGWSDRHIMFEMPDISIISRSITLRAHTVIDHVCK